MLVIDEEEATMVRQMFQWALQGLTMRAIARRLTDARIPTATDRRAYTAADGRKPCKQEPVGVWSISSVSVILTNPAYMGQMRYYARANVRHNGRRVSYRWRPQEEWLTVPVPAIIDPDTFAAVQRQLADNRHRRPQWKGTPLLRGRWFRCGRCGAAMATLKAHGQRYYRCSSWQTKLTREHRCPGVIRAEKAEKDVWDAIMQMLEHPEQVREAVARQQATIQEQEAAIAAELAAVESAFARCAEDDRRLVDAYVAGAFTAVELKGYRADVARKRQSLEGHRQELVGRREALQQQTGQMEALGGYCARVRQELQTFSLEEKHRTFEALALRVTGIPKQPLRILASLVVESSTMS
jgi:site-specific DNA recombinase